MGWMEFSYVYALFTFATRRSDIVIYSNRGGRGVGVFFRFSTYLIRAAFRAYKSVEICYLTELEG